MAKYKYEIIGHVDVDSGTLMIGDPCYFLGDEFNESHYDQMHRDFFGGEKEKTHVPIQHKYESNTGPGRGVAFGTTWGDGGYPVIAIWETESDDPEFPYVSNRPSQVFVDMNPNYDEADEYKLPAWLNIQE